MSIYIPLTAGPDLLHRCLRAVVEHTARAVEVTLVGEEPADPGIERFLDELDREVGYTTTTGSEGVVAQLNRALQERDDDVVLLAGHAVVSEGWLERMAAAGRSDTTVATASALGNNAGLLSVPARRTSPLPRRREPAEARRQDRRALAARATRAYRWRTGTAYGSRARRSSSSGRWTRTCGSRARSGDRLRQRCLLRGLVNMAADDVFVASVMPGCRPPAARSTSARTGALLERRYPYLRHAVERRCLARGCRDALGPSRAAPARAVGDDRRPDPARIVLRRARRDPRADRDARTAPAERRACGCCSTRRSGRDALAMLDRLPDVERLFAADVPARTSHEATSCTARTRSHPPRTSSCSPRLGERDRDHAPRPDRLPQPRLLRRRSRHGSSTGG